jgi:hypothetical protein
VVAADDQGEEQPEHDQAESQGCERGHDRRPHIGDQSNIKYLRLLAEHQQVWRSEIAITRIRPLTPTISPWGRGRRVKPFAPRGDEAAGSLNFPSPLQGEGGRRPGEGAAAVVFGEESRKSSIIFARPFPMETNPGGCGTTRALLAP